jgi:serine/threonine protein kinase
VQVLDGLTYLHKEQHAVHRDLKPANVLLNSAGGQRVEQW